MIVLTFALGAYANFHYLERNENKTMSSIRNKSMIYVKNKFQSIDTAVEWMAQRLDYLGPEAELQFWKTDAKNYLEDIKTIKSIVFVQFEKSYTAKLSNNAVTFEGAALSEELMTIINHPFHFKYQELNQVVLVKNLWNQKGYIIATIDLKEILQESINGFEEYYNISLQRTNQIESLNDIVFKDFIFQVNVNEKNRAWFEEPKFISGAIIFLGFIIGFIVSYIMALFQRLSEETNDLKIVDKKIGLILESSSLGFWTWHPKTSKLSMDSNCLQMLGFSNNEDISLAEWSELIHPNDKKKCVESLSRYLSGQTAKYENVHQIKRKDGNYIWVLDRGQITSRDENGDVAEIMGTYTEVTSLKQFEIEVENQKDELKALIQATDDSYLKINSEGVVKSIFKSANDVLELDASKLVNQKINGLMTKLGIEDFNQILDLLLLSQRECEFEFSHKVDDQKYFFKVKMNPLAGDHVLISFKNKTSEVEVFEEVNKQKSKFKTLFENSPFGMAYCCLDGTIVESNQAFKDMIGYTDDEVLKLTYWDLTPRKYESQEIVQLESLEKTGRYGPYVKEYIHKDGSLIPVELSGMIVDFDNGEKAIWSIIQDLTEKKKTQQLLEEQKLQALKTSKMAALGHMSGGVAHEINNPLTIISGNTTMLKKSLIKDVLDKEKMAHRIETIESNIERISKIIQSLRLFSKEGDLSQREDLEINSILSYAEDMISERLKSYGISLNIVGNAESFVNVSKFQIGQVFFNLLNNSIDAVKDLQDRWIEVSIHERKNNIIIRITDAGKIEDEKVIENLFTPFYTTKDIGTGMGLGLSVSRGIVESYGGSLDVDTNDTNTCFVMIIPSCAIAKIA